MIYEYNSYNTFTHVQMVVVFVQSLMVMTPKYGYIIHHFINKHFFILEWFWIYRKCVQTEKVPVYPMTILFYH